MVQQATAEGSSEQFSASECTSSTDTSPMSNYDVQDKPKNM